MRVPHGPVSFNHRLTQPRADRPGRRPPNKGATMKRALLSLSRLCVFMSVSLLAQATVTLSPSSYNFGSTPVGTGTAWQTFTLSNSGSSAVSISNVTVSGPFVVSSNCGSSVAANGSCPIYVYFAPTASGAASGTLTVVDSATQTAALSGTGGSGGSTRS